MVIGNNFMHFHRRIQACLEKFRAYRERGHDPQERRYRLERGALCVAAAYAAASVLMWRAMIAANNLTQQNIRASERPYVSLGKQDGTIAEFRPNGDYTNIIFWFHNGGRESAHDFTLNVCTVNQIVFTKECARAIHTRPIRPPLVVKGIEIPNQWVGVDFPGNSDRKELRLAIKTSDIEDAKRGTVPKGRLPFDLIGTIEYTDAFGEYCCKQICVMWDAFLGRLDSCWDPRRTPITGLLLQGREPRCPDVPNVCD